MGKVSDPTAEESHGKVLGVSKLRVINSSSLPSTPPGHTQGVTCKANTDNRSLERTRAADVHAEKLVDDIKQGRRD